MSSLVPPTRSRRIFEVVALLAIIAGLAFWMRPTQVTIAGVGLGMSQAEVNKLGERDSDDLSTYTPDVEFSQGKVWRVTGHQLEVNGRLVAAGQLQAVLGQPDHTTKAHLSADDQAARLTMSYPQHRLLVQTEPDGRVTYILFERG
ncbi:MAG: hypothetical protein AB7S38_02460 [Vulcanimicrobiota bacterium]